MFGLSGWIGDVGVAGLPEPGQYESGQGESGQGESGQPSISWVDLVAPIDGSGLSDAQIIDQLEEMERLTCAAAAAKARLSAELHARRESTGSTRGVAHEIALARHESPHRAREHTALALALVHDLPHTLAAMAAGELCEHRAMIIARESADLTADDRATLDATLGPQLGRLGTRETLLAARRLACSLDTHTAEQRARRARTRRHVTCQPLPDAMARLRADLPATDAVLVMQCLTEAADHARAIGDDRGRHQVMADVLVERLAQPVTPSAHRIEIQLVMNAEMLLGEDDTTPAHLPGYGPIPPGLARDLLADPDTEVLLRRLYAHPDDGGLVAMDKHGILFTGRLRRLLFARDGQVCRTPWCNAPVRHGDHVTPRAKGGHTTLDEGQGLCEACNYAKETPGWTHATRSHWPARHHVQITTPTGHTHHSHAPPLSVTPRDPHRHRPRPLVLEIYRPMPQLVC